MRGASSPPTEESLPIAPGALVEVRDAVWRVVQINRTSANTDAYHVVGVSEIVRDQEAIFLQEYEPKKIRVLDPATTALEVDASPGHRTSLLYLESLLRDVPPARDEIQVGHRAAMDLLDFQLDPARQALRQNRPRILIADAVGLGKTLEAGILLSELIRRGRGRRILVVALKSMLAQFQKEMWCRFSIPLVRLDSLRLQRIRERIPANHNPFHYFERSIISIDTLKQDNDFRHHVRTARWDVIVIDEAHNVAVRGGKRSQRADIALVLAERADALLLLSATPHDGKARSFASLMNMLDPTAIADPDKYGKEDIAGLYVRRFKKDVQAELGKAFPEPVRKTVRAQASPEEEEEAFAALVALRFTRIRDTRAEGKKGPGDGSMLFRTTLEKGLFSSPEACLETLRERTKRLARREDAAAFADDIAGLRRLEGALKQVDARSFSKYQALLRLLREEMRWTPAPEDRLVIFSERLATLAFLERNLKKDLGLEAGQVAVLSGQLPDTEQMHIVEEFGKKQSKLRLLLASDMAAEGLNLHYLCHRLVHFDIPWSLMTFQQRNGRIDRYGQERPPELCYLLTEAENEKIKGDERILELLIDRDAQARENIGDPSALLGVYDVEGQERVTAAAIEAGLSREAFDAQLQAKAAAADPFADAFELWLQGGAAPPAPAAAPVDPPSFFESDLAYLKGGLAWLAEREGVEFRCRKEDPIVEVVLPPDTREARLARRGGIDLRRRFRKLPEEVLPADGVVALTPDRDAMQRAMAAARREESAWPPIQFLWPLNPVVAWLNDKARGAFGRHVAPVVTLRDGLAADEAVVLVSGLIPNRQSQPLVHRWFASTFRGGACTRIEPFEALQGRLRLGHRVLPNRGAPVDLPALQALVPVAVERTRAELLACREAFEREENPKLEEELRRLEGLRERQLALLVAREGALPPELARLARRRRQVEGLFAGYLRWVQESRTTERHPFLQVLAVLRAEPGARPGGAS